MTTPTLKQIFVTAAIEGEDPWLAVAREIVKAAIAGEVVDAADLTLHVTCRRVTYRMVTFVDIRVCGGGNERYSMCHFSPSGSDAVFTKQCQSLAALLQSEAAR